VSGQTLLDMWAQIARAHAANTLAAIAEQRAAGLANRLEEYGQALSEFAGENGERAPSSSEGDASE
jgi:hypothetical protein